MNRLQLATLLSWAGEAGLQGRKRLQKIVYLLQENGCPLDCRYTLHHFGPYSRDVADRCDEMVAASLISEKGGPANGDMQYAYTLEPDTKTMLSKSPDLAMQQFQSQGMILINENLWTLELGSTILYFRRQNCEWDQALIRACEFKKVPVDADESKSALQLAKRFETRVVN